MTIPPIYAAPERLQPWIAVGLWVVILLSGFGTYQLIIMFEG
jgi:hypothetical protein